MPLGITCAFQSGQIKVDWSGEPNLAPGDAECGGSSRSRRLYRREGSGAWTQISAAPANPYYDTIPSITHDTTIQYQIELRDTIWRNEAASPMDAPLCFSDELTQSADSNSLTLKTTNDNPTPFSWATVNDAALSTQYESEAITISGVSSGWSNLTITNGEYSKNGGAWSSAATTISNGDTLKVRRNSAATNSTAAYATVNIGGITGNFMIVTEPPPPVWSDSYVLFPSSGQISSDKLIEVFGPQYRAGGKPQITIPGQYARNNRIRDIAANASCPATQSSSVTFPNSYHGARGYVRTAPSLGFKSGFAVYPNNPSVQFDALNYVFGPWCEFYWGYTTNNPNVDFGGNVTVGNYQESSSLFSLHLDSDYFTTEEAEGTVTLYIRILATGEVLTPLTGTYYLSSNGLA